MQPFWTIKASEGEGNAFGAAAHDAVRKRDQWAFWLFGVIGVTAGSLLWHMDAEGQWLVRSVSLGSVAMGLLSWGILTHQLWQHGRPTHRAASPQDEGFLFYSGGASHLEPIIGVLRQFAGEVQARATLLLESQEGGWQFKAGYQCSPGLGRAVAHSLHQCITHEAQMACSIEVLDASVVAFCSRMLGINERDYVLVALFEGGSQDFHGIISTSARRAVLWIRNILERVDAGPMESCHITPSMSGGNRLQCEVPVCCSVCDQVRISTPGAEQWVHWSQWLHQAHGLPLTHSVCPSCAGWLYDISLPTNPGVMAHSHRAQAAPAHASVQTTNPRYP